MKRWRCRLLQGALVDFAEGNLSGARSSARVERHIAHCGECASTLQDLREIAAALRELPAPDPGEAFWLRQRNQILASLPPAPVRHRRLGAAPFRTAWRLALVPVAAALVAVAGYRLLVPPPGSSHTGPDAIAAADEQTVVALVEISGFPLSDIAESLDPSPDDPELWVTLAAKGWLDETAGPPGSETLSEEELEAAADMVGGGMWG